MGTVSNLVVSAGRWPVTALLDLLAPPRCLACRRRGGTPLCGPCAAQVPLLGHGCRRCAAPRGQAHACWPDDAPVDGVSAAFDYRGVAAAAISTAKLAGAHAGWPGLCAALLARLEREPPAVDVVTWITTPTARSHQRGGDHAARLAHLVASRLHLPVVQLLAAREVPGGRDTYAAVHPLPGTDVLLVDDILTTGATAWRAAACLRSAGAGRIHLAVLARAGTHTLGGASRR